jgi:hypothetical protein
VIKALQEADGKVVTKRGNKRGIPDGAKKGGNVPGSEATWKGHQLVCNQLLQCEAFFYRPVDRHCACTHFETKELHKRMLCHAISPLIQYARGASVLTWATQENVGSLLAGVYAGTNVLTKFSLGGIIHESGLVRSTEL